MSKNGWSDDLKQKNCIMLLKICRANLFWLNSGLGEKMKNVTVCQRWQKKSIFGAFAMQAKNHPSKSSDFEINVTLVKRENI